MVRLPWEQEVTLVLEALKALLREAACVKALTAEDIRALLMAEGAVKVGFAPVERFAGAPIGHRPEDFCRRPRALLLGLCGCLKALWTTIAT